MLFAPLLGSDNDISKSHRLYVGGGEGAGG